MRTLAFLVLCSFAVASPNLCDEPRFGAVRSAEVSGELAGQKFRISVRASGDFPAQRIEKLELWIQGKRVHIPHEAYAEVWNPHPASVVLREAGTARKLLPHDVRDPVRALVMGGYDGEVAMFVLLEEDVSVVAIRRATSDIDHRCEPFDQRFAAVCEASDEEESSKR